MKPDIDKSARTQLLFCMLYNLKNTLYLYGKYTLVYNLKVYICYETQRAKKEEHLPLTSQRD